MSLDADGLELRRALEAIAIARDIAMAPGDGATRAHATERLAKLLVRARPLPVSPLEGDAEAVIAAEKKRDLALANERETLLRLAVDAEPMVAAVASVALIDATEEGDLAALRPLLESARPALRIRAEQDGAAARALLRLDGGAQALPWIEALVEGRSVPIGVDLLARAIERSPVRRALDPLIALLERDPLMQPMTPRVVLGADEPRVERLRRIAAAIAAIDRSVATREVAKAPADLRPYLEEALVDDGVRRLGSARDEDLPRLRPALAELGAALEGRVALGDADAALALVRLRGEPILAGWIEKIAHGSPVPLPLERLAAEAVRSRCQAAVPALADIVASASQRAAESPVWASLAGRDAELALRALALLDAPLADRLLAAAPEILRSRLQAARDAPG